MKKLFPKLSTQQTKSDLNDKTVVHNGLDITIPDNTIVADDGTVSSPTSPTFDLSDAEKQRLTQIRRDKGIGAGNIQTGSILDNLPAFSLAGVVRGKSG